MTKKILVTGTAGFIGYHLAQRLIERGDEVVGLDSVNDYYDPAIKYGRLAQTGIDKDQIEYNKLVASRKHDNYRFIQLNLEDKANLDTLFTEQKFDKVCNLAAQAGVRYSLVNPQAYIDANIVGFVNILEACRHHDIKHLAYASSSSVYGLNEAHTYSHLFGLPTTGLRFFTVYGPWGRPDMALFLFTKAILEDKPIDVFNHGKMRRDFTYVDDIVEGVVRVLDHPPAGNSDWSGETPDPSCSKAPYKIYNIGNSNPVELVDFIEAIEQALGKKAKKNMMSIQPGDVPATWANVDDLVEDLDYQPNTTVQEGVQRFIDWYKDFYHIK
ncbi:MAG: NAD-dependent epimerase [Planctomycetota bacterium]|jgi:UDP-glucuronate 4-epimerase